MIKTALENLLNHYTQLINSGDFGYWDPETEPVVQAARAALAGPTSAWQPIDTAPKDNARPLYLAHFNDKGELSELDFDGQWKSESESWEMPEVYHYWASASGIEEPTHWAYQDQPIPAALPKEES